MKRRRLNLVLAAVALALALATAALMVRSVRWADLVTFHGGQRFGYVKSVAGSVEVMWVYVPGPRIREFTQYRRRGYDNYRRVEAREGLWRREWFTFRRGRPIDVAAYGGAGARYSILIVPHWLLLLVPAAIGAALGRRAWRDRQRWKRHQLGQCLSCGYDLRASPACCPECGTRAAAAS